MRTVEWRTGEIRCYATFLTDKAFFGFMSCFQVAGAALEAGGLTIVREVHRIWEMRRDIELEGTTSDGDEFDDADDTLRTAPSYSAASHTGSVGNATDRVDSLAPTGSESAEPRTPQEELFEPSRDCVDPNFGSVIFGLMVGVVFGVLLSEG